MQLSEDFGLLVFDVDLAPFGSMMSQKEDLLVTMSVILVAMKLSCVWGETRLWRRWQRQVSLAVGKSTRLRRTCAFLRVRTTLSCAEKVCLARAYSFLQGGRCLSTLRTRRVSLCPLSTSFL